VKYGPNLDYVGDLAESWENPDDKTYVFKLREATFHNGQALEASHVQFSFERIASIAGIFAGRVANIDSYEVVDPKTIKITLKEVQADFIDGLILLSILTPEIVETIDAQAIGTGPFKFDEWVVNDHITLSKYDGYYEAGIPAVDKVTFRVLPEAQVAITNLQSGDVDAVVDVPVSQAAPLKDSGDIAALIVPTSSIHIFELMGKNSEAILSGPGVRQAIAYALDKNAVQQTVFSGEGKPKWSFVPSDSWAYKDVPGYDYDIEKAKATLAEAGYPDGFELTVLCISGYPDGEKAATIWQAGLAEIGVKLNIEIQELNVWLDNYINHTYDIIWNVFPGFADPNYFVSLGLQPHLADQWPNEEVKQIAAAALQTLDTAERTRLYGRIQDVFVQELPILVIQEAPQASLTAKNITGWEINPLGFVYVKGVSVTA
jgi:ABC-type transport system substrate-binding protein